MKKVVIGWVALCLFAFPAFADPIFSLRASDDTPADGDTVKFILSIDGSGGNEGLILARFDALLGGTGSWDLPLSPSILAAGLSGHSSSSAGTPVSGGVNDVILAINYQSFPWMPDDIGASGPTDIWSIDVPVHGNAGDVVALTLTTELHPSAGAAVFYSDGGNIAGTSQLATAGVTMTPEPATMALLGLGAVALLRRRRN